MRIKLPLVVMAILFVMSSATFAQKSPWKKSKLKSSSKIAASNNLEHEKYHVFTLDIDAFKAQLSNAPMRSGSLSRSMPVVSFPNQDGKLELFNIVEAPVLSPELALKHPNIKTYLGFSLDNKGARIRFSVTPQGVQTMTSYLDRPNVFTVPVSKQNTLEYITYDRGVRIKSVKDFECLTEGGDVPVKNIPSHDRANDQTLKTFRIAISTNGEYTNYWDDGNAGNGGTQDDALAQVVSTLNRNNEVFEADMAITFQLVTGTELIYPNAASDPYTGSFNSQLQSTLTSVVGEANYDIGHLFVYANSTNGNAGCIGCVCENGQKGSGFSQHPFTDNDGGAYMTDFFDIDYVPHEIGHQMGANHTFSHSNEGAGVNVEPGSGTTIMGYAGITGSNDVQDHSDAYFNYHSIRQILANVANAPNNCWTSTTITNNPPVANAGNDYTIPQGTAFVLKASASDPDGGDVLTYTWEQIDDGTTTSGNFGPTKTSGALWRSRPPSTNPNRYMPKLSRVVSGQLTETNPVETVNNTSWETVSTVGRTLNFALTVRDRSEGNGTGLFPQSDFDLMVVTVDGSSGPFAVSSQGAAANWSVGTTQPVTWDVANTTSASGPNTQNVNILLSTDGGRTFPITLASNVANDGAHNIVVPNNTTTEGRIMIEAVGNIFYAVNSADITISVSSPTFVATNVTGDLSACDSGGNTATYDIVLDFVSGFSETVSLSSSGEPAGSTVMFTPSSANSNTTVTMVVSNLNGATAGVYNIDVSATSTSVTRNVNAKLTIYSSTFGAINLTSPIDAGTGVGLNPVLTWDADINATSYDVEVATDSGFTSIVSNGNVATNSYAVTALNQSITYYWRVKPKNSCGEGSFSSAYSFTTQNCSVCTSVANTSYDTGTTRVIFNTIDNASLKENGGYSDFTNISTDVKEGENHDLTVHADTDGNYTTHTIVWIDWNQDCDFDDANEEYDLGTANNVEDGATTASPFTITIPAGATLGSTTMRVSTKYNADPTSCENSADAEVEDYTINVLDATASIKDFAFEGFNLYPNPSNGNFKLTFDTISSDNVKLQLFDLTGRLLREVAFNQVASRFSENISFKDTSNGLYLLRITNGGKQTTRKIVIE